MSSKKTDKDYGSENSIGLCSIDVIYSTARHKGYARRLGRPAWPRSTSHMRSLAGKDSGNLYEIIEGLKVYSDHSIF